MLRGFYNYKSYNTGINSKIFNERINQLDRRIKSKFILKLWSNRWLERLEIGR